jgi:hypothetical protein
VFDRALQIVWDEQLGAKIIACRPFYEVAKDQPVILGSNFNELLGHNGDSVGAILG